MRFATRIGSDAFGDAALAALTDDGIDVRLVQRCSDRPTGVALITVDRSGENCIVVASGANGAISPDDLTQSDLDGCAVFVTQLEIPLDAVVRGLGLARQKRLVTLLDPAPAQPLEPELLALADCVTPNASELTTLTGLRLNSVSDCEKATAPLREAGVATVIVTLGPEGAVLVDDRGSLHQPAPKVSAVDATAAGDAFTGALAAECAAGRTLREALAFAVCAGALATTVEGAQPAIPHRADVRRLEEQISAGH